MKSIFRQNEHGKTARFTIIQQNRPDYSLISKRAKTVKISIKTPTRGEISHLVIDGTGLKVFGEGEWKVRQHGADRRRVWRKLHIAADSVTHEIICADLSRVISKSGVWRSGYVPL